MKLGRLQITLWTILTLLTIGILTGLAQTTPTEPVATPTPTQRVVVSQDFLDTAMQAFIEVKALRDAVEKLKAQSGTSAALRAAFDAQIAAMNDLITIKDRKAVALEDLNKVYAQMLQIVQDMNTQLLNKLNKPKSQLDKILSAIKELGILAAGIALGRL